MKNIEKFNVFVLDTNETKLINGGSIFRRFGKWCGESWCYLKNEGWEHFKQHADGLASYN